MHGTYLEVEVPSRTVFTEQMDDNPGMTNNTVTFEEIDGKTTMTGVIEYPSAEIRQMVLDTGMTGGMDTSYDRLDSLLPLPRLTQPPCRVRTRLRYSSPSNAEFVATGDDGRWPASQPRPHWRSKHVNGVRARGEKSATSSHTREQG